MNAIVPSLSTLPATNQAILEAMEEVVLAADAEGHVRHANRAALELMGLSSVDQFEPQVRAASKAGRLRRLDGSRLGFDDLPLHRAALEGVPVREQFIFEYPDQRQIFLYATAMPIRHDGRVAGAVVVGRNLTDLMQLDRLKDQFLAVAAHELKTPLAIMRTSVALLERKCRSHAERGILAGLARIVRSIDRMEHIVSELLDVSQLQLGRFVIHRERLDLRELVAQAIAHAPPCGPGQHVLLRGGLVAWVSADRLRISQVLSNLVSNALKFSPEGGDVEVEVRPEAQEAIVSVRDHGIGIPRRRQARIFERFYRAHADTPYDRGGTGLGLYLAKEFVASHGGRIWFDSNEGSGATFSFSLPR